MNARILIDAIVRQTTVLLARLSTVEGVRSPLGHIANEVFAGLVTELENQRVSKKVIADMFGMALRSYRQKVQRLGESATTRGVTLWSAIHGFIAEQGSVTRIELFQRFRYDEEVSVRGILNDLTETGLVIRSGRGDDALYRLATEEELSEFGASGDTRPEDANAALVWLEVYREGPLDRERLAQLVPLPKPALDAALVALLEDGRIRLEAVNDRQRFVAEHVLIPLDGEAGWEAAVADHHRAVVNAIAAKLTMGARKSKAADEVGGTTLTFDLWPGHPREQEIRSLLRTTRTHVLPLWEEVTEYNRAHPRADTYQLHYYCGQYIVADEDEPT